MFKDKQEEKFYREAIQSFYSSTDPDASYGKHIWKAGCDYTKEKLIAMGWTPPGEKQAALAHRDAQQAAQGDAVHFRAVLCSEQRDKALGVVPKTVGFVDKKAAEQFILEQRDFKGWKYNLEPLYTEAPAVAQSEFSWGDGEPPKWFYEWFIAKLDNGQRVVLRRLPEEFTYDYTTADETYYAKRRIAKWMQFPDSQFVNLNEAPAVAVNEQLRVEEVMKNSDVIYAFRRRGFDDFCTCSKDRYNELSEKPSTFEVAIFYTKAPAVAVNEQLYKALRHLYYNAKNSGAEMGVALDVAADAIAAAEAARGSE